MLINSYSKDKISFRIEGNFCLLGTLDFDGVPSPIDEADMIYVKMFHLSDPFNSSPSYPLRLFSPEMSFDLALTFCQYLGGNLWEPQSLDDLQNAAELVAVGKTSKIQTFVIEKHRTH